MRVSRTRFSKRRSKRKTEFPIIAVVQKRRKPEYSSSHSFSMLAKETNQRSLPRNESYEDRRFARDRSSENLVESDKVKSEALQRFEKRNRSRPEKKSRATIDYKNVLLLRSLITAEGKILPRRINKLTAKQQRSVQKAIKSARIMGLVPFINKSRPFS